MRTTRTRRVLIPFVAVLALVGLSGADCLCDYFGVCPKTCDQLKADIEAGITNAVDSLNQAAEDVINFRLEEAAQKALAAQGQICQAITTSFELESRPCELTEQEQTVVDALQQLNTLICSGTIPDFAQFGTILETLNNFLSGFGI